MSQKRLLIDFDRVVHKYSKGWHDGTIYDEPVEGAIEAIKKLQEQGWQILIFTTRTLYRDIRNVAIRNWLLLQGLDAIMYPIIGEVEILDAKEYKGKVIVTNTKVHARAIIDDRAIRFTNWRDILSYFI